MLKQAIKRKVKYVPTLKLARPIDPGEAPKPASVRLDERDVRKLESRLPYTSPVPMLGRLQDGDDCYAILDASGEVGSFVWMASGRGIYVEELGRELWVPKSVAYLYEAFTFSELRGRGLFSELLGGVLVSAGRRCHDAPDRCEAWVRRSNKSSIRAFEKSGFEIYESFFFAAVGSVRLSIGEPRIKDHPRTWPDRNLRRTPPRHTLGTQRDSSWGETGLHASPSRSAPETRK